MDRLLLNVCSLTAVVLVAAFDLGAGALAVGVALATYLAWWQRRKQLAVESGQYVWARGERFGLRRIAEPPSELDGPDWDEERKERDRHIVWL